jgi:hypothetical protein
VGAPIMNTEPVRTALNRRFDIPDASPDPAATGA